MRKFTINYEQIQFTLEVSFDEGYRPLRNDKTHAKEWEGERLCPCTLLVISQNEDESLTHYFPGLYLRPTAASMLEDIEFYLHEEGLMDKILESWSNFSEASGPSWKKAL